MTNQTNLGVVISATDRASPVMVNVGKNMQAVGQRALSTSVALGGLNTAASGLGQAFVPLLGGLGPAAVGIAGLSTVIALGAKRFTDMRREAREVRRAQEELGTTLLISGLSASTASARIDSLRTTFDRLSFQAIPRMTSEMQVFLSMLDKDSQDVVNRWAKVLIDAGHDPDKAMAAAVEAMRNNFTLMTDLLERPINNTAELQAALNELATGLAVAEEPILQILERIGVGSGDLQSNLADLFAEIRKDVPDATRVFQDNATLIAQLLSGLSQNELAELGKALDSNVLEGFGVIPGIIQPALDVFRGQIQGMRDETLARTEEMGEDFSALVEAIRAVDPAAAQLMLDLLDSYTRGTISLTQFRTDVDRLLALVRKDLEATGDTGTAEALAFEAAAARFEVAARRIANARLLAEGNPAPTPAGALPGVPTPSVQTVPMPFQTFEQSQQYRQFTPHNSQAPLVIEINGQPLANFVIDVIDEEIRLREPGLGLG